MFTSHILAAFFAVVSTLASLSGAVPIGKRDVWDPAVTFPTAGSILEIGQTVTVTWSLADEPADISNPIGRILLQFNDVVPPSGPGSFGMCYSQKYGTFLTPSLLHRRPSCSRIPLDERTAGYNYPCCNSWHRLFVGL